MSWGAVAGSVIGGGMSLLGGRSAARGADRQYALEAERIGRLGRVGYNPFQVQGMGGSGVDFQGNRASFNLGEFGGANTLFQSMFNQMGPRGMQQMLGANAGFDQMAAGFEGQAGGLANMFGGQAQGLAQNGFQRGLQDQLFGQAGQFLGNTDFSGLRDESLSLLREMDAEREDRAFSKFQNQLQRQGMLGSTGGAQQMQGFFGAQREADLQRKLASIGLGQQQQMQNARLGSQYLGLGSGLREMEEGLMSGALDRFGATSQLALGLNQDRFSRGQGMFNQGVAGIAGQQGLQDMLLSLGTFGANLGATRAQTDLAAAGGAMQGTMQMGPSGSDMWGSFMTNLGSNMMQGSGGFQNAWQGLQNFFGNRNTGSGPNYGNTAQGWGSNPFANMFPEITG